MKCKRQKTLDAFFSSDKSSKSEFTKSSVVESVEWQRISGDHLNIRFAVILPTPLCTYYFENLEKEITYLTGEFSKVQVFGKWHDIPRKQSAYGDKGIAYKYSGLTIPAKPWTETLILIKNIIEKITSYSYNFVLVNRYADGNDKMGFHKDDEKELDMAVPIASFSLGASRDFVCKYHDKNANISNETIIITSGMLLLMEKETNQYWYHGLPPRKSCHQPRINLTFRKILPLQSPPYTY